MIVVVVVVVVVVVIVYWPFVSSFFFLKVWCVQYDPSGERIASVSDDKALVFYGCPQ